MSDNDEQIGLRLQEIRGDDPSQAALAHEMQQRGWAKWSQSTVWSVEQGRRPLRLAEAADIAEVLDVEVGDLLLSTEAGTMISALRDAISEVDRFASEVHRATIDLEDARTRLRLTIRDIDVKQVDSWRTSEKVRLRTLIREADKRMKWILEDLVTLEDRDDDWTERLLYSEPDEEGD